MNAFDLITRNTEEVLIEEDLQGFIDSQEPLTHYIGFEISGKIHLGTGIACMKKVRDFQQAGVKTQILLADWHTWINDKLGGDRELIREVAAGYFKEGIKASLKAVGGNPDAVNFVLGTDLYHDQADDYWATMIEVSKNTTLARMQRSIDILGRQEGESVDFAKLIYPAMQVADIFALQVNLAHAGTDQRKAHVVARDVAENLTMQPLTNQTGDITKPVAIHHHLILGLQKPSIWPVPEKNLRDVWTEMKMSKSVPKSAVFITDSPDEIREKIRAAFCPAGEVNFNPITDWVEHLLMDDPGKTLTIKRPSKHGGNITYEGLSELKKDFAEEKLHPLDLKNAVAEAIVELLKPVRDHFSKPENAKLVEKMEQLTITR